MIISAVCTCTEQMVAERAAHAFLFCMKIFPGRTIPLLVTLIADEVRRTGSYFLPHAMFSACWPCMLLFVSLLLGAVQLPTLFRGNDIASHLLSAYCQLVGRKYLVKTVKPFVEKICSFYAQDKSFEVISFAKYSSSGNIHPKKGGPCSNQSRRQDRR